jgi:hypothetical protein
MEYKLDGADSSFEFQQGDVVYAHKASYDDIGWSLIKAAGEDVQIRYAEQLLRFERIVATVRVSASVETVASSLLTPQQDSLPIGLRIESVDRGNMSRPLNIQLLLDPIGDLNCLGLWHVLGNLDEQKSEKGRAETRNEGMAYPG